MRYSRPVLALAVGAAGGLATAPLHAARPEGIAIGVCGHPGLTLRIPLAPGRAPARDEGAWGCHGCDLRKRPADGICGCDGDAGE
ncbi:hypothetical protein F9288_06655 [Sphingomonas sp. CL5.1]|uniref:hypothetical protein n=1 Tax=Sphingomonas sp. CL5.1 TaxID=2653203 RepID=UPI0015835165|nr:hypothetical protein [Sphingomonas sp. CL5.1]QKR99355.1 hypothetical protein F9288_06655 [Sphingomonas sp. CL5.1]